MTDKTESTPTPSAKEPVAKGLRIYTVSQLVEGHDFQKRVYDWDLSKETEFIENLFCQRFNFLLILYSLVITAAASSGNGGVLQLVLWYGFVLCTLVSLTIWRVYVKLIVNLRMLHSLPKHPFEYVQREVKALGPRRLFGVNSIIGLWVPVFCVLSLLAAAVMARVGMIAP